MCLCMLLCAGRRVWGGSRPEMRSWSQKIGRKIYTLSALNTWIVEIYTKAFSCIDSLPPKFEMNVQSLNG